MAPLLDQPIHLFIRKPRRAIHARRRGEPDLVRGGTRQIAGAGLGLRRLLLARLRIIVSFHREPLREICRGPRCLHFGRRVKVALLRSLASQLPPALTQAELHRFQRGEESGGSHGANCAAALGELMQLGARPHWFLRPGCTAATLPSVASPSTSTAASSACRRRTSRPSSMAAAAYALPAGSSSCSAPISTRCCRRSCCACASTPWAAYWKATYYATQ